MRGGIVAKLLTIFVLLMGAGCTSEFDDDVVEWNPPIVEQDLLGLWRHDTAELNLLANGHYSCSGNQCQELLHAGRWQRDGDFYVEFTSKAGKTARWRIILIRKTHKYQFVEHASESDIRRAYSTFTKF
jgi:hypothetical protein